MHRNRDAGRVCRLLGAACRVCHRQCDRVFRASGFGLLVVRLFLAGVLSVLSGTWLGGNILFHYTLKDILLYVFQVLYFILCTWLTGTTLGKRAMNLRVISVCPGEPLGLLDVVYRGFWTWSTGKPSGGFSAACLWGSAILWPAWIRKREACMIFSVIPE